MISSTRATLYTALLVMLAALVPTTEPTLNSTSVQNTSGLFTFNFYCSPSQPPSPMQLPNARLDGQIIAITYRLLRAILRWSSGYTSAYTHVQRDVPPGRNGAVSEASQTRTVPLMGVLCSTRDWKAVAC